MHCKTELDSLDGDATARHDPSPAQQWNTALEMTPDHASWRRISKNKRNLGSCSAKNTAANASRIAQDRQAWTESVAGQCDARMQEEKVWLQGKRWKEEAARRREKRQAASDKRRYTHFRRYLKQHMNMVGTTFRFCYVHALHSHNSRNISPMVLFSRHRKSVGAFWSKTMWYLQRHFACIKLFESPIVTSFWFAGARVPDRTPFLANQMEWLNLCIDKFSGIFSPDRRPLTKKRIDHKSRSSSCCYIKYKSA